MVWNQYVYEAMNGSEAYNSENEDENITLIWDDELDKPVCESCYNNTANEGYKMLYQLEFLR